MNNLAVSGGKPVRIKMFPANITIGQEEKNAVNRVLESGILSKYLGSHHENFMGGPEVRALEEEWAEYFDGPTGTWVGQQSRTYQTWTIVGFLLMHHFLHVNPDDVLMLNLDESMGH